MKSKLLLEEWEIWHTFSTYITANQINLDLVAEKLVTLDLADCVILSSGSTICRTKESIARVKTELQLSGDGNSASINFSSDKYKLEDLTPYSLETWTIGSYFLFCESKLQLRDSVFPSSHLRAFLKPVILGKQTESTIYRTQLYPVVILYQTGVLTIEFRMFSPSNPVDLNDFIRDYVELHEINYDLAIVTPPIANLAAESYHSASINKKSISEFIRYQKAKKENFLLSKKISQKVSLGDFEFEFIPLPNEDKKECITSLAQTFFVVLGFLIESPISFLSFIFSKRQNSFNVGDYWIGKPHVHIVRHSEQQLLSSSNREFHKASFAQIASRSKSSDPNLIYFLPDDLRMREDYSAFLTSAFTLWIWSKKGLEDQQKFIDINKANLIYEHQIQAEILDYGLMLHRSLLNKSQDLQKYEEILHLRKLLAKLKSQLFEVTPYGEVRDFFFKGWEIMNIAVLQDQISENLSILENEMKFIESKSNEKFRLFLSIFGIIASASLAKSTISPIWKLVNFWLPADEHSSEVFLVGVSGGFTLIFVFLVRYFTYR